MRGSKRAVGAAVASVLLAALGVVASTAPAQAAAVTFTVNSLADTADANVGNGVCATAASVCTLRAALSEVDANSADTYTIDFSVTGSIQTASALPEITSTVDIDGSSAPGYSVGAGPEITILADGDVNTYACLSADANNVTIRALRLSDCTEGIENPGGSGLKVVGNQIGNNGSTYQAALDVGVGIELFGTNDIIGGTTAADRNVISGFLVKGIRVQSSATTALVEGNYIGTNAAGTAAIKNPNGTSLFSIDGATNTPNVAVETDGPSTTITKNVISGNPGYGIDDFGSGASATITSNLIGTDATGTAALGNTAIGVYVSEAAQATIGGTAVGAGNVVAATTKGPATYFIGTGILVDGSTATIQGNWIGTNSSDATGLGNTNQGIGVEGTTVAGQTVVPSTVTIGGTAAGAGNVVSANSVGMSITGSPATTIGTATVQGNRIGTNAAGTSALGNTNDGIDVDTQLAAAIGGTTAGAGNVISGNGRDGIDALDNEAGITIQGNEIGTNTAGTAAIGNAGDGVTIGVGDTASPAAKVLVVGGTASGAGNVISGNAGNGVTASGAYAVEGNKIGTNGAGTAAIANVGSGVSVNGAATVGGSAAGAGNLISGNGSSGVLAQGTGFTVQGNKIGTNLAGSGALANGNGITVFGSNGTIGGVAAGQGNVIAFDTGEGINNRGQGVVMRGNLIHDHTKLSIDNFNHAPAAPNGDQVPPLLTTATVGSSNTSVAGTVTSSQAGPILVDVYASNQCQTAFADGEAKEFLGTISVPYAGGGVTTAFSGTVPKPSSGSDTVITAIATAPVNGSSEFSTCLPMSDVAVTFQSTYKKAPIGADVATKFTVTNNGPAAVSNLTLPIGVFYGADSADDDGTADMPSQGSINAGATSWNVGSLASGASATVCLRGDVVRSSYSIVVSGFPLTVPALWSPEISSDNSGLPDEFRGNNIADADTTVGSPAVTDANVCPLPTLSIDDASVTRPASGTTPLTFTVHLSAAQTRPVTVHYSELNGTAIAVEDYTSTTGTVTFPAGATSEPITIPIVGNQSDEPDKTFTVQLDTPVHATLADGTATGTIDANHLLQGCPTDATLNQRFVCHLYFDALGRPAESGGFTYWVNLLNKGTPRTTMATSYLHQPESLQKVADRPYVLYLGRHATASVLSSWATQLSKKTTTPEKIRISVLASSEYYTKVGATPTLFVQHVYQDVFRRPVDSSGLSYWVGRLNAGQSRTTVVTAFLPTAEGRIKVVGDIFLNYLRRLPTTTEANTWVTAEAKGKTEIDVGISLVSSTEYYNRPSSWTRLELPEAPGRPLGARWKLSGGPQLMGGRGMAWTKRFATGISAGLLLATAGVVGVRSEPAGATPVTFTVNDLGTAGDASPGNGVCATATNTCTLRAAIDEVDAEVAGTPTIAFSVAGTINLTAGVGLDKPVVLDGSTAPGYTVAGGPVVTLLGPGVSGAGITGMELVGIDETVRGLRFAAFNQALQIDQSADHATIVGNQFGNDGSTFVTADEDANEVEANGPDLIFGGTTAADRNVVSGFLQNGVVLQSTATNALVEGNYIGTNAAGTAPIRNPSGTGIFNTTIPNVAVGTCSPSATITHNLISGNPGYGIDLFDAGLTSNTTITSNLIGTTASGTAGTGMGNTGLGIFVSEGAHATIGGTASGAGNVVVATQAPKVTGYTTGAGIDVDGSTATIQGNDVGTNAAGASGLGNVVGILEGPTTTPNTPVTTSSATIGGTAAGAANLVSGNTNFGVLISGAATAGATDTATIQGNLVGTTPDGTAALGNGFYGLAIDARAAATVGGSAAGAGNLVSGNAAGGIALAHNGDDVEIYGNEIGTNLAGTAAVANAGAGISDLTPNVASDGSLPVIIGGPAAGAGNVISGNTGDGIELSDTEDTTPTVIQGNRIGTNAAGTAAIANQGGYGGIHALTPTTIGGAGTGAGNLISGNTVLGIQVSNTSTDVEGNRFGTNAAGTSAVPNGTGNLSLAAVSGQIGGIGAGQPNLIVDSTGYGIGLHDDNTESLPMRGNLIYGNTRLDIDRRTSTLNGTPYPPLLTTASVGASNTSVAGTVTSDKAGTVIVDVYASDDCQSRFGTGEAKEYLGSINVVHPGGGVAQAFSGTVPKPTNASYTVITAIATTPGEASTQLSTCAPVTDLSASVQANTKTAPVGTDEGFLLTVKNLGPAQASNLTLPVTEMVGFGADSDTADTPSQGTYDTTSQTWNIGDLPSGATATVCLRATPTHATITLGGYTVAGLIAPELDIESVDTVHDPYLGDDVEFDSSTVGPTYVAGAAVCPLPTLSVDDASVVRPATGTTPMTFTVHLSSPQTRPVTVQYAAVNGTAVAVDDFTSTSGTLTFPAGATTEQVTVPIVGNQSDEPDKTFTLQLTSPVHATLADGVATGTVQANHLLQGCPPGSTNNQRFVCHLYFDALGRAAESGGFTYWVNLLNKGTPRSTMATSYLHQSESLQRVADRAYVLYLARHGTASVLKDWATKLAKKTATPEDIRTSVLASSEYYTKVGATPTLFVQHVYQDVFRRPVDASGLSYWVGRLNHGDSRTTVVKAFLPTAEGRIAVVTDIYLRYLRRVPTTSEANSWVTKIKAGKTEVDVGISLVSSTEYYTRPSD